MNVIQYSVNTRLAHFINEKYYNGNHFVWVSPFYSELDNKNPASSTPKMIYDDFKKRITDLLRVDNHFLEIERNKSGILKGAIEKEKEGVITAETRELIVEIVKNAKITAFVPYVYVIPNNIVSDRLEEPHPNKKANIFSTEFIIKDLKSDEFDIIMP